MVIPRQKIFQRRNGGMLMTELAVALAILVIVVLPLSFATHHEQKLLRACFYRAVAMEIVDGEMELLAAGGWNAVAEGANEYHPRAQAQTNLPPGKFMVIRNRDSLSLQWVPGRKGAGGPVTRTLMLP